MNNKKYILSENKDLERFLKEQETNFQTALNEVKKGKKETHWMWYIFPQIEGLGSSSKNHYYSIQDIEEAKLYLNHPILGSRLIEICNTLYNIEGKTSKEIFGHIDNLKLRSCMTLFSLISEKGSIFDKILAKYFNGEKDTKTLDIISPKNYNYSKYLVNSELRSWDSIEWLKDFKETSEKKEGFREVRQLVFDHTRELTYKFYSQDIEEIQSKTIFYDNAKDLKFDSKNYDTKISVFNADCLEAGKLLTECGLNPIVLNMANRKKPGGGVLYGAGAQEENIFRRSNLFLSLYQFYDFEKYLGIKVKRNYNHSYPLNRDSGGVYSTDITVFRSSEATGYDLLDNVYKLSFVTVPAISRPELNLVNGKYKISDYLAEVTKVKIRAILNIALVNNHDSIVLSALGCGAFRNPPEHIAELFKEVLSEEKYKKSFKVIVFAIIEDHNSWGEHNPEGNLIPFQKAFK